MTQTFNNTTSNSLSILDFLHFDCPTQEQKIALQSMADFVKEENTTDFLILCGAAGTGKTSITSALLGYLNQHETPFRIAAPTARAARILGKKTNTLNSTIHSMIYNTNVNKETGVVTFTLKEADDDMFRVYIVDEASMINTIPTSTESSMFVAKNGLLTDLAKFIKSGNPKNKLILLGDNYQLPPVFENDSYALMPDYLSQQFGWKGGNYFLTEVKRQEDGSYIMKNAIRVREAIKNNCTPTPLLGFKFDTMSGAATSYVKEYNCNGADSCISIGSTHKANKYFNDLVRERLYGKCPKLVVNGDFLLVTQKWERGGNQLFSGDHVIVEEVLLENMESVAGLHFVPIKLKSKKLDGTDETIEDYLVMESITAHDGKLSIQQEMAIRAERHKKNVVFRESGNPEDDRYVGALKLMYGHAITCNKAQGGEWDKVFMSEFYVPNEKWRYTALTRAKSSLLRF